MTSNTSKSLIVDYNIQTEGNVSANYFIGDGSQLTNINGVTATSVAKFVRTTIQTGIVANSAVICNVQESLIGTDISVNTTTGSITLQPGKTYRLRGSVGSVLRSAGSSGGTSSQISWQWFNATSGTRVGNESAMISPNSTSSESLSGVTAELVVTPSVLTTYQLRVTNVFQVNTLGGTTSAPDSFPWIDVEVLGGQIVNTSVTVPATVPNWINAGAVQSVGLGATTTAPTLPTVMDANAVLYRQLGPKTWQVSGKLEWTAATGAVVGSGDYLLTLPNGLRFDFTVPNQQAYSTVVATGTTTYGMLPYLIQGSTAFASFSNTGTISYGFPSGVVPYNATQYRMSLPLQGTSNRFWNSGWFTVNNSNASINWSFTFQSE